MIDPRKVRIEVWTYRANNWLVITDTVSSEELFSTPLTVVQAAALRAVGLPIIRTDSHGPSCNQAR